MSVLILASLLEGSVWAEPLCTGRSKEAAWEQLQSKAVENPENLARYVEAFRSECGLPLVFWAGPKAEQSQKDDHPCGEVLLAFVQAMPSPSDPFTQSEEVFEFGPAGEVTQRWWVPVDAVIEGAIGRELIILEELGAERASLVYLAISPEGEFRVVPANNQVQRTPITCPTSKDLPKSSYLGCWRLTEKASGIERLIAYEGPCS
jgi:hypothetical protein